MVMAILREEPAFVRKGGDGAEVRESPAYGWFSRVTVTGGPASTVSSTSKAKVRGRVPGGTAISPR